MKRLFLILCIAILPMCIYAQKETWNWAFGNKAGLTWQPDKLRSHAATGINGTANTTLDNLPGAFTTSGSNLEGVFSMSDKDGNLLFYSNGMSIWKGDLTAAAFYTALGGNASSAQSGIVVPYPGDENKYICIGLGLTSANNMGYVIVQANSPSNVSVVGSRVAFGGHTGTLGESMSAVRHANGQDWWIVSPGKGSPMWFNAWLATPTGVQATAPAMKTNSNVNVTANTSNGYFKFTPDAKHFVYPTWTDGKIIVGDFDNNTGVFSNIRVISRGAYGAEFSPNQKYLYTSATTHVAPIGWYVWDFEALLAGTTTTYLKYISSGLVNPYALQLDPTGRIWGVDLSQTGYMFLIDNPDEPDNLRTYRLASFLSSGATAQAGLPSFSATFFSLGGDKGFCMNKEKEFSTSISATIGGGTVAYTLWSFGDGSSVERVEGSGQQKKSHTYTRPGDYTITVSAYGAGDALLQSQTMDVKVNPCVLPVNPNIHMMR